MTIGGYWCMLPFFSQYSLPLSCNILRKKALHEKCPKFGDRYMKLSFSWTFSVSYTHPLSIKVAECVFQDMYVKKAILIFFKNTGEHHNNAIIESHDDV